MRLTVTLAAALLAASTALHAQAPADTGKGRRHFDCSQAKDPKACEERLGKMAPDEPRTTRDQDPHQSSVPFAASAVVGRGPCPRLVILS